MFSSWVQNFIAVWCYTARSLPSHFRESESVDLHPFHFLFHIFYLSFLHRCLHIPCSYFQLIAIADSCLIMIGSRMFFITEQGVSRWARNPLHAFVRLNFVFSCHEFLCKSVPLVGYNYFLQGQCSYWVGSLSHCTKSTICLTHRKVDQY